MCFRRGAGRAGFAGETQKIDLCVFGRVASLSPHFRHLEWLPPSRCRRLHWRAEPSLTPAYRPAGRASAQVFSNKYVVSKGQKPDPPDDTLVRSGRARQSRPGSTGLAEVGGSLNKRHCLRPPRAFMGAWRAVPQRTYCRAPVHGGTEGGAPSTEIRRSPKHRGAPSTEEPQAQRSPEHRAQICAVQDHYG